MLRTKTLSALSLNSPHLIDDDGNVVAEKSEVQYISMSTLTQRSPRRDIKLISGQRSIGATPQPTPRIITGRVSDSKGPLRIDTRNDVEIGSQVQQGSNDGLQLKSFTYIQTAVSPPENVQGPPQLNSSPKLLQAFEKPPLSQSRSAKKATSYTDIDALGNSMECKDEPFSTAETPILELEEKKPRDPLIKLQYHQDSQLPEVNTQRSVEEEEPSDECLLTPAKQENPRGRTILALTMNAVKRSLTRNDTSMTDGVPSPEAPVEAAFDHFPIESVTEDLSKIKVVSGFLEVESSLKSTQQRNQKFSPKPVVMKTSNHEFIPAALQVHPPPKRRLPPRLRGLPLTNKQSSEHSPDLLSSVRVPSDEDSVLHYSKSGMLSSRRTDSIENVVSSRLQVPLNSDPQTLIKIHENSLVMKASSYDEKKFIKFGHEKVHNGKNEKVVSNEDQPVIFKDTKILQTKPIIEREVDLGDLISVSAKVAGSNPIVETDPSRILSMNIQNQLKQRRENRHK